MPIYRGTKTYASMELIKIRIRDMIIPYIGQSNIFIFDRLVNP